MYFASYTQLHNGLFELFFEVTDTTTCVLEQTINTVTLRVKIVTHIVYMDIATRLARFLTPKVNDDMILAIKGKLEMNISELKQFGYSIDRLRTDTTAEVNG